MNELLLETVIEKLQLQEKKMQEQERHLQEILKSLEENNKTVNDIANDGVAAIQKEIRLLSFPIKEMQQLTGMLNSNIVLLQQPQQQRIKHHHYLDKGIIISLILFTVMSVLVFPLLNAYDRNDDNEASDIKYRSLQLNRDKSLQKLLYKTDSFYLAEPAGMKQYVIREEAKRKAEYELFKRGEAFEKVKEVKRGKGK